MTKPESFDRIEDRFKLTLLQIEKRFVDLEMNISDFKAKLKDVNIDAVTSLQKRVEDLEDLSMVENVGVIELKKMLEGIKTQFGELPAAVAAIPQLDDRMKKLEAGFSEIGVKPEDSELQQKVEKLRNDVAQLIAKPTAPEVDAEGLKSNIQNAKQDLENLKMTFEQTVKTFDARIREAIARPPEKSGADFEFFNSRLESLKTGLNLLSDKKVETDLKIAGVEEKINILDNRIRESLSQKFVDEIKLNKRDIMTASLRVESIEKVIKELTNELNEMNKTVKKFENFERLTILNKDVEDKLQRFKFVEDQTSKLSSRIEVIYDDLNNRYFGLSNMKKDVEKVSNAISDLNKQFEKNRIEVDQKVKKEDVEKNLNTIYRKFSELEKTVVANKSTDIGRNKEDVEDVKKQIIELNEKVDRLNREFPQLIIDSGQINDRINSLMQKIATFDGKIGNLFQMVKGAKPIPQEIKMDDKRFSQIFSQLSSMEDKITSLEKEARPEVDTKIYDEEIEELLGKLVFLESRMAAIEKSMHETSTVNPIILE